MNISTNEFLKRATKVAEHFGFRNDSSLQNRKECLECKVSLNHTARAEERKTDGAFGLLTNGINIYTNRKLHAIEEPVFYYGIEKVPRTNEVAMVFQVFGVNKSIAEVVLIQTIRSLLTDIGFSNHLVRVNSLGDRDSQNRYIRELTNFFRKRLDDMPPSARELMKENVTSALIHLLEKEHDLAHRSPSPLEHLSDPSRRHFREIVEYLDMSEILYEIDPKLLGHYNCYHDTLFSFDLIDDRGIPVPNQPIKIRGGRYSAFFEKHLKKSVPVAGAVVVLKDKPSPARIPKLIIKKPAVHLVHIGFGPKIRALSLIDQLRQDDIIVEQSLASDSISEQLLRAEESGARYAIIIGQKEYVDGTVILRDLSGKNQEIIPQNLLASRLRKAGL